MVSYLDGFLQLDLAAAFSDIFFASHGYIER